VGFYLYQIKVVTLVYGKVLNDLKMIGRQNVRHMTIKSTMLVKQINTNGFKTQ